MRTLLSLLLLSACATPTIPKPPVYTGADFAGIHYIGGYDKVVTTCDLKKMECVTK